MAPSGVHWVQLSQLLKPQNTFENFETITRASAKLILGVQLLQHIGSNGAYLGLSLFLFVCFPSYLWPTLVCNLAPTWSWSASGAVT